MGGALILLVQKSVTRPHGEAEEVVSVTLSASQLTRKRLSQHTWRMSLQTSLLKTYGMPQVAAILTSQPSAVRKIHIAFPLQVGLKVLQALRLRALLLQVFS